jgi:ADP-ribosylglycohydrolase
MALPNDYVERVYAGVLGKLVGVYLGRPFEGWSYERIMAELGEVWYYVNDRTDTVLRRNVALIVTDDDITGTFTFLKALPDYGNRRDLTPQQIGQSWLNYIIEGRTILWWGGVGNSTEHTAYARLKNGIAAPESGSIARNGKVVAEQIGAQIFIDGWAMVAPGDPELAADFARRAASVSHDGEAIYGAQVLAAMEAQAFVERDINKLIDCGLSFIPRDSVIARMIDEIRTWHAATDDWRINRERIDERYGYHVYGGNCHMVPNHGLIIFSLLHGNDDFQKSLMIVNTSGWDTDCNSGNLGCLLGIKNGLATFDAGPDWRGPVADRLYLPTGEGGDAISDAVRETYRIVNIGRALQQQAPLAPKNGARFHFELPGAVQGWQAETSARFGSTATLENVVGHSATGARSLAIRYSGVAYGRPARVATVTFIPPEAIEMPGYALLAAPTLHPGQTVRAAVTADPADAAPVTCRLFLRSYGAQNRLETCYGPETTLAPGAHHTFTWPIAEMNSAPIAEVGIEIDSTQRAQGTVYLDYLTWDGAPDVLLTRQADGEMWRRAWVDGCDQWDERWPEAFRLAQNSGVGMISQGSRDWIDYRATATIEPHLAESSGLGVRVQGMRRYYALLLCVGGTARLVKALDGTQTLAECAFDWSFGGSYELSMQVVGNRIQGWIDGRLLFDLEDADRPLTGGAVALLVEEGRIAADAVRVQPAGGA